MLTLISLFTWHLVIPPFGHQINLATIKQRNVICYIRYVQLSDNSSPPRNTAMLHVRKKIAGKGKENQTHKNNYMQDSSSV